MSSTTKYVIPENFAEFVSVACNICGCNDTRPVFTKWGYFHIVQCVKCGLTFVSPRAFRVEEDDYFKNSYLATIEKNSELDPGISGLYSDILYNLSNRVLLGRLLDVGCAMGHFLAFAQRYGWQVEGVECSPYAARYASERCGVPVHAVSVLKEANLPANFYNCCVLVEVIEHLPDPRETLQEVFRVLEPGGEVYLTTPNFACYRSMLLREEWSAIIPTGHLYYFDGNSLRVLLSSIGFIDIEDLTGPSEFAKDLEFAQTSGLCKLRPDELAGVMEFARVDGEQGAPNRRGEGLIVCARKPWDSEVQQAECLAKIPTQPFKQAFAGCLLRRPGESVEDKKIYYVENGRKRWVTSAEWMYARGLDFTDVRGVTAAELDDILPGPPLP